MNRKTSCLLTAAALMLAACDHTPQLGVDSTDDVIASMTLEEKAHLVIGTGQGGPFGTSGSAVIGNSLKIVPGAAGTSYEIPRLGIPPAVLADGPAGLRIEPTREGDEATYYCTHFPIGTLLACTWNQELVESVGQAMGNEVLEYGADIYLAPALNIHRNPLCGRNFEYYSEDPVVSGKIAAAYVRGVQSNGVGTSIKHFAANNQEGYRTGNDARVSPRAMRELYLKGFEIAVKEGDPWTVMSSYNLLNGTYTSEREDLITTILRDEWGYKGMVMTDWNGGKDAVAQMRAGNDMLQPGNEKQFADIVAAVSDGSLDEAVLDRNVKRILEMVMKTPRFKGYKYSDKPDLEAHAAVTRQSATEGMVLLKNDGGALPLAEGTKNVALFGVTSYKFIAGGTGSGDVNHAYVVSLLDGLRGAGYETDNSLEEAYTAHIASQQENMMKRIPADSPYAGLALKYFVPGEMPADKALIADAAGRNDAALITIGRNSGEGRDRTTADFCLSDVEQKLIRDVCATFHAQGKKVVVVLNVGGVIETASWKTLPDAILCAWQGGQEGGNSVADILRGNANPSGKLTMTFPVSLMDHASSANFPLDEEYNPVAGEEEQKAYDERKNLGYTTYEEGIYVGYRYFDTFGKKVSYPFGYGLSYTKFDYSDAAVTEDGGTYTVTVNVKNVGGREGKEVVQLYVAAPDSKTADKPVKELKAFAKTASLQPGETAAVTMTVAARDLASFNEEASAWKVTAGTYKFLIGASSADIRATVEASAAEYEEKVNDVLRPQEPINEMKR